MKSTELRIGNYIKLMLNHEDYKTIQVTIDDLSSIELNQGIYEPLELTEEWILKFGFQKHGESRYGVKYVHPMADWGFTIETHFDKGKWFFGHEYYDSGDEEWDYHTLNFCFDLEYVHQLQNLFHAITNEEISYDTRR